ncbi:MAG: hypothetical protein N3A54_02190 [Patescibacteria group bacterium]|nr:hypothetical protein [Patescibacteria group bacterium]
MKRKIVKNFSWEWMLFLCFFIFSFYVMTHTFGYDAKNHSILFASRVWSDFGAHIPLIRSFSLGHNWPPEYPLFPGEKIRYHFLFYLFSGLLEKIGVRIDWAVNIPSILGFFFLLVMIYKLGSLLFEKKSVGLIAVVFFLFNGSLSFVKFFETHPLGLSTIQDILHLNQFSTFGPWSGDLVTAFVHLNVYTNQRHLAPSFAIALFIIYSLLKMKKSKHHQQSHKRTLVFSVFLGVLAGSLFFLNHPALLITMIFCSYLFLFHPYTRLPLGIIFVTTLPFLWYFFQISQPSATPTWEVGYLSPKPFQWHTFFEFWFHNLGLHLFLIPIGLFFAPKRIRFFFLPLVILFIIPNLYRFSPDMINNHKFFNFFTIIGGMYVANLLIKLFSSRIIFLKLIALPLFVMCIFSGILDFIVIRNDYYLELSDIPNNTDASFIAEFTPKDAVILNSTWFYHPASIAGRKIYNGYSFFTWSAGYPTYQRESFVKQIFQSNDRMLICTLLKQENISFVELNRTPEGFLQPIGWIWETFSPIYDNKTTGVRLYNTDDLCADELSY